MTEVCNTLMLTLEALLPVLDKANQEKVEFILKYARQELK